MFKNKRIIAVVPARGGSKGIKLKNLRKINGKSLVELVGETISQLDFIDYAVVSTDHKKIAKVASDCGLRVPFMRPKKISGDLISDIAVLTHTVREVEKQENVKFDIIVMLQPTSPFRRAKDVKDTIFKLIEGGYDSVITVSITDTKAHPLKQLIIKSDRLNYYDKNGKNIIARQQLGKLYHRNGVAYAMTRNCLFDQKTLIGSNSSAVIIEDYMVNIDTEEDLQYAQYLCNKEIIK